MSKSNHTYYIYSTYILNPSNFWMFAVLEFLLACQLSTRTKHFCHEKCPRRTSNDSNPNSCSLLCSNCAVVTFGRSTSSDTFPSWCAILQHSSSDPLNGVPKSVPLLRACKGSTVRSYLRVLADLITSLTRSVFSGLASLYFGMAPRSRIYAISSLLFSLSNLTPNFSSSLVRTTTKCA